MAPNTIALKDNSRRRESAAVLILRKSLTLTLTEAGMFVINKRVI